MKRQIAILVFTAGLLAAAEPLVITKESAGKFYRGFKRLTGEPRFVDPQILTLCGSAAIISNPLEVARAKRARTGPHTGTSVHIYANPAATGAIAGDAPEFPEGAVIVKEKLGRDAAVTGVGGMIKRAKGYDPKNGDWEFFFFTPGGDFTTGKLANCIDCHSGGKRDHAFSVWSLATK